MKHSRILILAALLGALAGCATDGPATDGASVRSMVARQIANPEPQRAAGAIDGRTAVNMVRNYTDSYATPQPQQAGSAFGK
jgi:hypothetical protein